MKTKMTLVGTTMEELDMFMERFVNPTLSDDSVMEKWEITIGDIREFDSGIYRYGFDYICQELSDTEEGCKDLGTMPVKHMLMLSDEDLEFLKQF